MAIQPLPPIRRSDRTKKVQRIAAGFGAIGELLIQNREREEKRRQARIEEELNRKQLEIDQLQASLRGEELAFDMTKHTDLQAERKTQHGFRDRALDVDEGNLAMRQREFEAGKSGADRTLTNRDLEIKDVEGAIFTPDPLGSLLNQNVTGTLTVGGKRFAGRTFGGEKVEYKTLARKILMDALQVADLGTEEFRRKVLEGTLDNLGTDEAIKGFGDKRPGEQQALAVRMSEYLIDNISTFLLGQSFDPEAFDMIPPDSEEYGTRVTENKSFGNPNASIVRPSGSGVDRLRK